MFIARVLDKEKKKKNMYVDRAEVELSTLVWKNYLPG